MSPPVTNDPDGGVASTVDPLGWAGPPPTPPVRRLGRRLTVAIIIPLNVALAALGYYPYVFAVLMMDGVVDALGWRYAHHLDEGLGFAVTVFVVVWALHLLVTLAANRFVQVRSFMRPRAYWAVALSILAVPWVVIGTWYVADVVLWLAR